MQKKKIGRPAKNNPIKAGELRKGLMRFTFIAEKELITRMKDYLRNQTDSKKTTIKAFMERIIEKEISNAKKKKYDREIIQRVKLKDIEKKYPSHKTGVNIDT